MDSDAYLSVFSTKTSGWSVLQISFHGKKQATKDGSDLRETIMMDSGTTINIFVNPNMTTNRQKTEYYYEFYKQCTVKKVYQVGEIPGAGQAKFHPDIIENILSLNEMTKK